MADSRLYPQTCLTFHRILEIKMKESRWNIKSSNEENKTCKSPLVLIKKSTRKKSHHYYVNYKILNALYCNDFCTLPSVPINRQSIFILFYREIGQTLKPIK